MDQKELRELEQRCIQEEPPECVAACPLHVDARALCGFVKAGRWTDAWKVLQRTMPFPGILGRICDAPCMDRCKCGEAGDPVRVNLLERACVTRPAPRRRMPPLPSKEAKVAVVGGGLSGLTAAYDLARKGYRVTLLEPESELAANLMKSDEEILPPDVVREETTCLTGLDVEVIVGADVDDVDFPDSCLERFDAVYLSLDADIPLEHWDLEQDEAGRPRIEPKQQSTSREKVFAGGRERNGAASPVWVAAEGRWAATSIDRLLQGVSPTAGREKEGPHSTRLFTSLEGVEPQSAMEPSDQHGYTEQEAMVEAGRCLECECLECVKVCAYLERFNAYPRKYAREIYNNESIVMGPRQANKLINSCSLCGLCEAVCPEDFAMQDICLQTRQSMVERGKMPPSAHEFALLDMEFSLGERFLLCRHEPGHSASAHAFFPGCQLSGSAPEMVRRTYDWLRSNLSGGVGLMLGCCAAPAHWAGREEQSREELAKWRERWEALARPRVVTACSTCYRMFRENLSDIPVVSLWQTIEEIGNLPYGAAPGDRVFALHDPCTTRPDPEVQEAVRTLLQRMGVDVEELKLSRGRTECCGFGGLMQDANPDLAAEVVHRRAAASELDYIAYCAVCRDNLAGTGKRALHLLDLLFPSAAEPDPAGRARPGWSQRRENRERLKHELLRELWNEALPEMEEYRKIVLKPAPGVAEILERRRILWEDLQRVVHRAEATGERFVHPQTGHFRASHKPFNVTFWVEYTEEDGAFVIHNAYSHRMEVASA